MSTKTVRTIWGVLFFLGLAVEVYALVRPDKGDTLSEVQDDLAQDSPIVPFAVGVVAGHWYWLPKLMSRFLAGVAVGSEFWKLREGVTK